MQLVYPHSAQSLRVFQWRVATAVYVVVHVMNGDDLWRKPFVAVAEAVAVAVINHGN